MCLSLAPTKPQNLEWRVKMIKINKNKKNYRWDYRRQYMSITFWKMEIPRTSYNWFNGAQKRVLSVWSQVPPQIPAGDDGMWEGADPTGLIRAFIRNWFSNPVPDSHSRVTISSNTDIRQEIYSLWSWTRKALPGVGLGEAEGESPHWKQGIVLHFAYWIL